MCVYGTRREKQAKQRILSHKDPETKSKQRMSEKKRNEVTEMLGISMEQGDSTST